ncbi:MAG: DUF1294 domain-containing protein [Eubacterium sp.]|nr:DUF1294 domain-containing protein [Eubacterium sp.]
MQYLGIYLVFVNVIAFLAYGVDKYKAKKNLWRVPEKTLIGFAAVGGFAGAFLGMQCFRHKTKHMKFVIGIPVISVIWIGLLIYLGMKII